MINSSKIIKRLRTLFCATMLLSMASGTTHALFGLDSHADLRSPTPTSNQFTHESYRSQALRAQSLMATKQLVVEGVTSYAVGKISIAIHDIAYRIHGINTAKGSPLVAQRELESLNQHLLSLTTESEKSTHGALESLIPGSDPSLIHRKNSEVLLFLELNRYDHHGLLHRMFLNKYILVGLPVVTGTLAFLYRDDLKGVVPALREGYRALSHGTINANEVARQVGNAIKEIPNLESTKQIVGAAKTAYAAARNERQRKKIALGVLGLASLALLQDTYRHVPSRGEEARTRGTYAPSRLFSYLNNSMRFSGNGGYWKLILGMPFGVLMTQGILGSFAPTKNNSWNTSHLGELAGLRENWMYSALGAAKAHIAARPDRVGFRMYARLLPLFAGSPAKVAIFTILTAGLASHSIRGLHTDINNEELGILNKMFFSIKSGSEIIGAVALAALLTNWLTELPPEVTV